MRAGGRRRDERGSAVVDLVWLGVLLILPLLWIVVTVGQVQAGAFGTTAAARAAGRAFALAPDDATGEQRARAAAQQALADQGHGTVPMTVRVTCDPDPGDCHDGGSVITVDVATRIPLPAVPDVFGDLPPAFALDATHTVPIGQYQETG